MAEGSLTINLQTLESVLSGVATLTGEPPTADSPGTRLVGAAALAEIAPTDLFGSLETQLTTQLSGTLDFDASSALTGIVSAFEGIQTTAAASPLDALSTFTERIAQTETALSGDFVSQLTQALAAIERIANQVPENPSAVVGTLLEQLLGVLAQIDGPESDTIRAWILSIQELHRTILPLIEEAQNSGDPAALLLEVVQRTLSRTLEVFNFSQADALIQFLDGFPDAGLPAEFLGEITGAVDLVSVEFSQLQAQVDIPYPDFRDVVGTVDDSLRALEIATQPLLQILQSISETRLLQPNGLEIFLRELLDSALAVEIQEAQEINDPFMALFDRLDEAIAGIDLDFVRDDVLGFFQEAQATIEEVNVPSIGDTLQQQIQPLTGTVQSLEGGVGDLLAQLEGYFDELQQQIREATSAIGTFQPDDSFQYHVEHDLRELLTTARTFIGGDPGNPNATSIAGTVAEFQSSIEQLVGEVANLLAPVEPAIEEVRTAAVQGINDFRGFLEGLNIGELTEQLRLQVEEVIDLLVPIDFDLVVDPVVEELETNAEKLRGIDPSSLNEVLRGALQVALDVVISIEFTAEIRTPLEDEFAVVKALPQAAIDELQLRYEEATALLNQLEPENLLDALFSAFDIIETALNAFDLATLLAPLDQLHNEHLQEPLAQLRPSTLLQPVSDAYQTLPASLDALDGAAIVQPLTEQLDALKAVVADFDITSWLDDLLAAIEAVKTRIGEIRPSTLLQPLVADFQRIEAELERFNPSVIFEPVADLAAPLLALLDNVQQETIDALFQLFQEPLQLLDRLEPESLIQLMRSKIDDLLALLQTINLPGRYNQLKGTYFDLNVSVQAQGEAQRAALIVAIDPEVQLGSLMSGYNNLITTLQAIRDNLGTPDLSALYTELRERLLAILPPYARALLDRETFLRVMRLADPTRFLEELDQRFQAIKDQLLPIRPEDISAELDASYEAVLALVENLDITDSLNQVGALVEQLKGIVNTIRVDFVAGDIDNALNDVRALFDALDPSRFFAELDSIHDEVVLVVESTRPSQLLSSLQEIIEEVRSLLMSINPRETLAPPLIEAWASLLDILGEIDFTIILSPLVDKLDELEAQFFGGLERTEDAFDDMLTSVQTALSGGGASGGVSVGGSI